MKKLLILAIFSLFLIILPSNLTVNAACDITDPTCAPAGCPNDYVPDFTCINNRIFQPGLKCAVNICRDAKGSQYVSNGTQAVAQLKSLDIFGVRVNFTADSIPSMVNLAVTTILFVIALYAMFRGLYVAGFVRPNTTDEKKIEEIGKELTNLVIGLAISFTFIIVLQIAANILGYGDVTKIKLTPDPNAKGTITITTK